MRINSRATKDLDMIKEIVSKSQVIRVAMGENNMPYLIPLNYGYEFDGEKLIFYCHCSDQDKKLDILDNNPNVFVEIDNECNLINGKKPCRNNLDNCSIISSGKVEYVYNIYDKIHGLKKIMEHDNSNYSKEIKDEVLSKIFLLKITCNNLSAKSFTI